jgi:hypothetical protein
MAKVFPNNHSIYCMTRIQQNVFLNYGNRAASYVYPIATSYSACQDQILYCGLEQFKRANKPTAKLYLENIALVDDATLPPRYCILSSNISEAAMAMLEKVHLAKSVVPLLTLLTEFKQHQQTILGLFLSF